MSNSKQLSKRDIFIMGGILAVLGVVALFEFQFLAALFLIGLGIVFMGSTSKEFRKKIFDFFFSLYKTLVKKS